MTANAVYCTICGLTIPLKGWATHLTTQHGELMEPEVGEGHVGDDTICPDCGEDLGEGVPHKPDCRFAKWAKG